MQDCSSPLNPCPPLPPACLHPHHQVFQGVWRLQQGRGGAATTRLSYSLFVRPAGWLPVALVEARIKGEIKANLAAVRDFVERRQLRQRQQQAAAEEDSSSSGKP